MSQNASRRKFIKQSALLSTAWWVGANSLGADSKNKVEKLNFACIGVGGKGSEETDDAGREGNVVALCDIDDLTLEKKGARFKDAKRFNDFREMLDTMGDKIDAVTVSTPDHCHAVASAMAMKKGKHCFTQKPLTWSVYEARRLREIAKEMNVKTQMGNQGTSLAGLRTSVEIVRSGAIGNVREVHVWTNRPIWPQGKGRPDRIDPIPKHVHWNLFLGPAAERPFVNGVYHTFNWRGWLDFGTGALGDMGCHVANMAVMALDLFDPTSISAVSPGVTENETYPTRSVITYKFPERGKLGPCTMIWYDGKQLPPEELFQGAKREDNGCLLIGDKGTLYCPDAYGERRVLLLKETFKDFKNPEPSLPRSPGHFKEWANACRGGEPSMSNFDYASRLTETILLGNFAIRAGKPVEWDAKNMKVTNVAEANEFVHRKYRYGYSL